MRLDKFLKVSRLIKRRTLAKEVAEAGRIWVNGRAAKPATEVSEGDEIVIDYGRRRVSVRVETQRQAARVAEAREMYTVLHEEYRPDGLLDVEAEDDDLAD